VRITPEAAPGGLAAAAAIEIKFATRARLQIAGAVDAATLTAAVVVLAEGRRRSSQFLCGFSFRLRHATPTRTAG
jgi:hypothetical protein